MDRPERISEYRKRKMINVLVDKAIEKITRRHLLKAFRESVDQKIFCMGDTIQVAYTVTVSGEFTAKPKRPRK